ncbi:MAG: TraR/DksA family transcriptional regulator [Thiomonas sp.]|jgi:Prokaryotic dksA/traR C4-type zinc finger.
MHPTLMNRRELDDIRLWLSQEIERLQLRVQVSDIDAAGERSLIRRRRAQAALCRLEMGTYGAYCKCGLSIEVERLRLDPAAPFCADCQAEIDDRRRAA